MKQIVDKVFQYFCQMYDEVIIFRNKYGNDFINTVKKTAIEDCEKSKMKALQFENTVYTC